MDKNVVVVRIVDGGFIVEGWKRWHKNSRQPNAGVVVAGSSECEAVRDTFEDAIPVIANRLGLVCLDGKYREPSANTEAKGGGNETQA